MIYHPYYLHDINAGRLVSDLKCCCAGACGCVDGARWGSCWLHLQFCLKKRGKSQREVFKSGAFYSG